MQLEDYFEFEKFDTKFGPAERIRIKGHRIAIEHVLDAFKEGLSPEGIAHEYYPTLSLLEVYATILFYLANKEQVEDYLRGRQAFEEAFETDVEAEHGARQGPSEVEKKVAALRASRRAASVKANG